MLDLEILRICKKCNSSKKVKYFKTYKSNDDDVRFSFICKECENERGRNYRKLNRDEVNNRRQISRKNNPEHKKELDRRYFEKNRDSINDKTRTRRRENPLERKLHDLTYRVNNKEKIKKSNLSYVRKNRGKVALRLYNNSKKYRLELRDSAIRQMLKKQGFSDEFILKYPQIIECKRIIIKTKRLCQKKIQSPI